MAWFTSLMAGAWAKIAAGGAAIGAILLYLWNMRRKARREGRREAADQINQEQRRIADETRRRMAEADRPVDRQSAADSVRQRAARRNR